MSVKWKKARGGRTWHDVDVDDRELVCVNTPTATVSVMTGTTDINGKRVLTIEIMSSRERNPIFELTQKMTQLASVILRTD